MPETPNLNQQDTYQWVRNVIYSLWQVAGKTWSFFAENDHIARDISWIFVSFEKILHKPVARGAKNLIEPWNGKNIM